MTLSPKARQQLKARAHKLKPVILLGNNGLTEPVKKEIDRALRDHELIKIRIPTQDRDLRRELFSEISSFSNSELVQTIGCIGVLFRKNVE